MVLVITAIVAGSVGTFVLGVSSQAVVNATHATHTWLTGLLLFPIAVVSLLLSRHGPHRSGRSALVGRDA